MNSWPSITTLPEPREFQWLVVLSCLFGLAVDVAAVWLVGAMVGWW